MSEQIHLARRERHVLSVISVLGLLGPNGVFVYCAVFRWDDLPEAMRNPVAAAFIFEAFVVMALLAWQVRRFRIGVLPWADFLLLSLVGGIASAFPYFYGGVRAGRPPACPPTPERHLIPPVSSTVP